MKISRNRVKEIIRQEIIKKTNEVSMGSVPGMSDCPTADDLAGVGSVQGSMTESKEQIREKINYLRWVQENC